MASFNRNVDMGGLESDTEGYCSMLVNPVHSEAVVSLSSVQPGLCLSGSKDKSVILYDYLNKRQEDKWTGHEREITKVCYGSSCLGVFSASRDKTIKMWQRGSSHVVREFIGHDLVVTAIHANSDTTRLCSGSRDNTVKIWDVETAKCLVQSNIPQNLVTDVKWIPNTEQILQTGEDKEVRIFDSRNMDVVYNFIKKQYIQMACDITTDGTYCLTCSNGFTGNGCEASLWDLRNKKLLHEFNGHLEAIESCIFLPNQSLVATASRDCSVKVWNRDTQECITEWCFDGSGPLTSVIAYEDNSILVGTFNQGIQVLEMVNDKLILRSSY
ncbi:hypothetical protein LOTGIDRAFT_156088 [Lottia gigantea]|uniref:Uncharacterized protein n=1 Tax=Lottia gigantea TaxID=225164 RepID=V4B3D6_LOTGI|nr:hypothetical protein LOTGIDRAFT_156088 [Lottia gigantea]ESP04848.1 hypothetical protein LOTGIDRAFT_156088 [Lottia gigantea]